MANSLYKFLAHLTYDGENVFKVVEMDRPCEYLKLAQPSAIKANCTLDYEVFCEVYSLIFIRMNGYEKEEGIVKFRYKFSHIESHNNYSESNTDYIPIGFEQPDKNVNLDKLKKKLRKGNKKLKNILRRYYDESSR